MTDNFPAFSKLTADRYQQLAKQGEVFEADVNGDDLYQIYLESFPEGTNPIFKERTEHDCSCCKQFVRRAGNMVAVTGGGQVLTIWDEAAKKAPEPYNIVATILRDVINVLPLKDLYRVGKSEASFGTKTSHSLSESGRALTWNHFYTDKIPTDLRPVQPDTVRGDYRTTVQVFQRGLETLTSTAVETVLALIDANNLYRGTEFRGAVNDFQKAQKQYLKLESDEERNIFLWTNAKGKASRIRNSAIGTLLQDISEGMGVEKAVTAFEAKVAPQNYKRTTAIITPGMVKEAMKTVDELGLEDALERRFARIEDISVNDVLWVDNTVKPLMKGGLGDALMEHAEAAQTNHKKDEDRAQDISLEAFMSDVLGKATGMEVLFKGEHLGNLMSLTAPVHPEPKQLFKWDNDFAWSYHGNIADSSIKERVKRAGGNVTNAALRVSLSWFNTDDLDIHVYEPGGSHIYFGDMYGHQGGHLDVDMNVQATGASREAVENVSWKKIKCDGAYKVVVNNYNHRESKDVGFVIEVESAGKVTHFNYQKEVRHKQDVTVVTLHVKDGMIARYEVGSGVTTNAISQEKWGLNTETYVKVNAVTLSPNYWGDNAVGNKHTFFVLDGCVNDESCRGIYNEFLHGRLEKHRKVFEVIGDKTKCQPTEGQLSGLGFSSTKKDSVIVKVYEGKRQRLYNVQVGT